MQKFPGLVGPQGRDRNLTFNAEAAINLIVQRADGGTPKSESQEYQRPGLDLFASAGSGPITAMLGQDGRCFVCSGVRFCEVLPSGNVTTIGTINYTGFPATLSTSGAEGHQVFITSGGLGYIYDTSTDTLTQITDPAFPTFVSQGLFFDSSFLVLNAANGAFMVSDLYDGLNWNGLNVGLESQFSDKVVAFTKTHDNLWLFGTRNTAPWANNGAGGAAGFVPIPGSVIEHGTAAAFACVEVDNAPMWLGQDAQGSYVVWRANGYTPVKVSTFAIEYELAQVADLSRSIAMTYQELGHTFYVLYVPGLDYSFVYDLASEEWTLFAHWVPRIGNWMPYVGTTHTFIWGKHLVGDRRSGAIYEQSLSLPTDNVVTL